MRIEHWYLTPHGWIRGTVSEDGVERDAAPPEGHAAILRIVASAAGQLLDQQWLSQDEARAPTLREKFGDLPEPVLAAKAAADSTRGRETRAPLPTALRLAGRSMQAFYVQAALWGVFWILALAGQFSGLSSGHKDGDNWARWIIILALAAALAQLALAIAAFASRARGIYTDATPRPDLKLGRALATTLLGWLALVGGFFALLASGIGGGGAWGRPLRIRGKQRHPSLTEGADWTEGERPDPSGLDLSTRRALEALWLTMRRRSTRRSLPSRASRGCSPRLVRRRSCSSGHTARPSRRFGHTRACFALAAGYAGRSHTVEPMPDLLLARFDPRQDPRVTLAIESLGDGCQLEDFNADVAAACAAACTEPATRRVLQKIAREERTHADFSWAVLDWLLARHRAPVTPAIERTLAKLRDYPRPTAVAHDKRALLARGIKMPCARTEDCPMRSGASSGMRAWPRHTSACRRDLLKSPRAPWLEQRLWLEERRRESQRVSRRAASHPALQLPLDRRHAVALRARVRCDPGAVHP